MDSPKPTESEDQEPTYIELTSKKVNGFDATPLLNRSSSAEPAFQEEEPVRTDPEIDKDDSLIDVEDVKVDSPPPLLVPQEKEEEKAKEEAANDNKDKTEDKDSEETIKDCTGTTENAESKESKIEAKKEKKYNPLDVANLTSKDPPKSRSPPRKKLLPSSIEYSNSYGRYPRPWRPDGGLYYGGEDVDYSVPITTAYLKHMRSMAYQDSLDGETKVSELIVIM